MNAIDVHPFSLQFRQALPAGDSGLDQCHYGRYPDINPVGADSGRNSAEEVADEGLGKKFAETE